MGIVIQRSARNLLFTYSGFLVGFISTLWLYPLAMTKEEIGLVRLLINVSWLLSALVSFGAVSIPTRFFPYFSGSVKEKKEFTFFVLSLGLLGYLISFLVLILFKETIFNVYRPKAPLLADYLPCFMVLTFVVLLYSIIDAFAVVQHESNAATFAKELLVRVILALALIALAMKAIAFKIFVICVIFAYTAQFLFLFIYLIRKRKFAITFDISFVHSEKFSEMLVYGGFVILGNATGFLMSSLDGLMLSAYKGLGSTGIYTMAYFIATIVDGPRRALSQAIIPVISQANKQNDIEVLKSIYQKFSLNQLITGGGL
ncbi:MAG: oligosaccharide flippase family protein, partial [Candidatus Kryptoniota bacterium]